MTNRISFSFASLALEDMTNSNRNTGRQIEMSCSVKRKRGNSGRSESRERKMSKSCHRSASDYLMDSLISSFSSLALLGDTSISNPNSGSQVEMRQSVKRRHEKSGRSEMVERKRRRLELQSDSSIDSLTSAFSCLYISTPAACGETPMKGSSTDQVLSGLSHLNNTEVTAGETPVKDSRNDEGQPKLSHLSNSEDRPVPVKDEEQPELSHLNNTEVTAGETPAKDSRNDEGQPRLSHLSNSEDRPVPVKDEEQPELSHSSNTEVRLGRSPIKGCIIDEEQPGPSRPVKLDQGVKRKRENYGRTVSSERKRTKLDPDFYPPAPHGEAYSSGPSAGGQSEKQGGKRTRKTDRRSRSEHQFETLTALRSTLRSQEDSVI